MYFFSEGMCSPVMKIKHFYIKQLGKIQVNTVLASGFLTAVFLSCYGKAENEKDCIGVPEVIRNTGVKGV